MARHSVLAAAVALAVAFPIAAQNSVAVLTLAGDINPISARYVKRGLDRAAQEGAELVVLELDTPGGLGTSMDQIVEAILASEVAVAVWVAPSGASAASAGAVVAMAAHVAAMAPGTRIGAAHPVGTGGQDIEGAMGDKVLNDAEARLRSLAMLRGRSQSWAEAAVRRSVSLTDREALEQGVVDLAATDIAELLTLLEGRAVSVPSGLRILHPAGATLQRLPMSLADRLLVILVNPDLAYILLVIGILGILFEFWTPGIGGAGIAGGISLVLALLGFGSLPTNVGGLVFIAAAVVLFAIDIKAPAHGIWTAGGIVAFVLGSVLLFPPWRVPKLPAFPEIRVDPVTIVIMSVLLTAFFVAVLRSGLKAQGRAVVAGAETLPGRKGWAVTDLSPEGEVQVAGERWSATAREGHLGAGDPVEVLGREGLRLMVRRAKQ